LATFANRGSLADLNLINNNDLINYDLTNNNRSEYVKIMKMIFECFDSFSKKSEHFGKAKIDEWAQIQTEDGDNAIKHLLRWTVDLYLSFPIFNNFVFLYPFLIR